MIGRALLAAGLGVILLTGMAAAQSPFYERNQAASRCYRDAERNAGSPPRHNPRPGDDLVAMERARRDYDDRYYAYLSRCLDEADRRLRQKRQ